MYVYLQDLYFLLNYYLKCVYINESSDDIYNCFWKLWPDTTDNVVLLFMSTYSRIMYFIIILTIEIIST